MKNKKEKAPKNYDISFDLNDRNQYLSKFNHTRKQKKKIVEKRNEWKKKQEKMLRKQLKKEEREKTLQNIEVIEEIEQGFKEENYEQEDSLNNTVVEVQTKITKT
ncbi:unnamed protein product [Blepharisma stoltei]|uniref:Uncharacterized protein n=1 Tax=Blepharisma stoltei TaxID=1481888 RepID=A0AAU9IM58_9CILI|nr:unnamed protein product [Blepharisma stoltei]